jgi:Protein of unknown function (DUF3306)
VADFDDKAEALSLSRWSRLKRAQAVGAQPPLQPVLNDAQLLQTPPLSADANALAALPIDQARSNAKQTSSSDTMKADSAAVAHAEATLPPLSSISLTEDFTPFMQAKVPQALKQQALKALFKAPHFNVMDRLDTYIDDYTVFEPITPDIMDKLSAWRSIQSPLKQVVTPGGYAVDEASEEGKAVLAERARLAALTNPSAGDSDAAKEYRAEKPIADGDPMNDSDEATDQHIAATVASEDAIKNAITSNVAEGQRIHELPAQPIAHPRYGKRVSDFKFVEVTIDNVVATGNPLKNTTPEKPQ